MSVMHALVPQTHIQYGCAPETVDFAQLLEEGQPVILKGAALDMPLLRHGLASPQAALEYLEGFYSGRTVTGFIGAPDINGRFAYNTDMTGMNYEGGRFAFPDFAKLLTEQLALENPKSLYMGSTDLELYFPGLDAQNHFPVSDALSIEQPLIKSIWLGNRTTAAAHYDMAHNIAICVAGRRRFTLFPPDQVANLYPGPLDPTPGGQAITMVDISNPNLDRYPRFAEAIRHAQVAELDPGDVLFYPAMWWHNVEALDPFNILINYWWNKAPGYLDSPHTTLLHGILSLRDRSEQEKLAWRALFDYYIFGKADMPSVHLPEHIQGMLAPLDDVSARRLRAMIIKKLNR